MIANNVTNFHPMIESATLRQLEPHALSFRRSGYRFLSKKIPKKERRGWWSILVRKFVCRSGLKKFTLIDAIRNLLSLYKFLRANNFHARKFGAIFRVQRNRHLTEHAIPHACTLHLRNLLPSCHLSRLSVGFEKISRPVDNSWEGNSFGRRNFLIEGTSTAS